MENPESGSPYLHNGQHKPDGSAFYQGSCAACAWLEGWKTRGAIDQPSAPTQPNCESPTLAFSERLAVGIGGILTIDVLYSGNPYQRIASIAADPVQRGCVLVSYCPPAIDWEHWSRRILAYINRRGWHRVEELDGRRGNRRYTPTRRDEELTVASDGQ